MSRLRTEITSVISEVKIKLTKTPFLTCWNLATGYYQLVTVLTVLIVALTVCVGNGQTYTLDWSEYRMEQTGCGLPSSTDASSSYYDLDQDRLQFGNTKISITHGPDENTYCASGKIRNKNGGESYVYSATLDAETRADCSWMIIEFSEPVNHVSFDLIDVDIALLNNWQDELTISPAWTTIQNNANLIIDEDNHTITGSVNCDSHSQDCNTRLIFDKPLMRIRIDYCYGSGTTDNFPDRQIYNIGNIEFEEYKLNPNVTITENCPGEESILNIQDLKVEHEEILEIIFADTEGMIDNVLEYPQMGVYNIEVPKTYTSCGDYPVLVRVIDSPTSMAQKGEMLSTLDIDNTRSYMLSIEIIDNESPTFPADQQDIVYLQCNDEIPESYFRPARDNCLEPSMIHQEVWDEYLEYNDACTEYNVRRYWSITDLCGNTTVDHIDYIYQYDEDYRSLGDAEDIIEACNVFSPNGDGINDYFVIYLGNLNIAKSEFYIFDRSGNPRYQELNIKGERAESSLGGDLRDESWTSGVYVWMLKLTDTYGNTKVISREVTILL